MKRTIFSVIAGTVLLASTAGTAFADSETNPTTNDAIGFCNSNHARFFTSPPESTVGTLRREQQGDIADALSQIRTPGTPLNLLCTESQSPS